MNHTDILQLLRGVIHPETATDIVSMGMVENLEVAENRIKFDLKLLRPHDPFATSVKKSCEELLTTYFPDYKVVVFIKEPAPKKITEKTKVKSFESTSTRIIAISSAKGGVGKSTVTANLALSLSEVGYRVGILDADVYGPSQHILFGLEDHVLMAEKVGNGDKDLFIPAQAKGIKIISIGFFIKAEDALVWRGPMATGALRQMIQQTHWGELDFLLIDMPPGTGDIHLTITSEMKIDGAVVVTTPHQIALADVIRGIAMFRSEHINIPVLGIVENMAWFTPSDAPQKRYYLFGQGEVEQLAEKCQTKILTQIPLICQEGENSSSDKRVIQRDPLTKCYYDRLSDMLTNN